MKTHNLITIGVAVLVALIVLSEPLVGGYENYMARNFGGTLDIPVPEGHTVVNCTWKENNLWVLYQDNQTCEMFFQEYSLYGIAEGKVKFTTAQ